MPCDTVKFPGGGGAIVCSRGRRSRPCAFCPRTSSRLCDGPKPNGKTCDKPICDRCTWQPDPDVDFCPECAPMAKAARAEARLDIDPRELL